MTTGRGEHHSVLTKTAVVVATGLLLLSGAALAGREDTIDFNRDLLRERLEEGRATIPAAVGRFARTSISG